MAGFSPSIILSAVLSVVQVVLTMVPGVYYARRGMVDQSTRRSLSAVTWGLLLPAMAFYTVVSQFSASTIAASWPFAANAIAGTFAGMALGWAGAWAIGAPRDFRGAIVATAGYGNLNGLPLLIVQAACQQDALPFASSLGSQCTLVGFGYVTLGAAARQITLLPFADWLLAAKPEPPAVVVSHAPGRTASGGGSGANSKSSSEAGDEGGADAEGGSGLQAAHAIELCRTVPASSALLPAIGPAPRPADEEQQATAAEVEPRWQAAVAFLRRFYLQPTCLVPAVALGVACIAPLRNLLVPQTTAPLGFAMGAIHAIQMALLFVTSFVLGAVLARGPGPGGRDLGGWRPCALLLGIRFVLLPVVGSVVVLGSHALGWWAPLDPVFSFVLLLQWAVPSANQVQTLASIHGNGEAAVGALIFWQWVAALVAVPAWMIFFLWAMGWAGLT